MKQLVFVGSLLLGAGMASGQTAVSLLDSVRLTHAVMADGKPLAAGTYQVRLTDQEPTPAVGQSPHAERWVEFVKGGKVAGREVASVISAADIGAIAKGPRPKTNGARVDVLKGGDYVRVWINHGGNDYLVNLPKAS